MNDFFCEQLSSRQLLALLHVCECRRKGTQPGERSPQWRELCDVFADRFKNLNETLRFEVLEAHLMSVEDIDIYDDEGLKQLLIAHKPTLDLLNANLEKDTRFA